MNAKKAKALRKVLNAKGFDFRDAKYEITNLHDVNAYSVDGKGKPLIIATVTAHTAVLHNCGRQLYKQLKKVAA